MNSNEKKLLIRWGELGDNLNFLGKIIDFCHFFSYGFYGSCYARAMMNYHPELKLLRKGATA